MGMHVIRALELWNMHGQRQTGRIGTVAASARRHGRVLGLVRDQTHARVAGDGKIAPEDAWRLLGLHRPPGTHQRYCEDSRGDAAA